jgi:CRISPR-associated protein Cas1
MPPDGMARLQGSGSSGLLERMLSLDALENAWHDVRGNKGGPGKDGVSLKRFERLLEANLLALADEVRLGTYRPGRPLRVRIRKHGKERAITILPVRDRVLQRAALDVLEPYAEPVFLPCSYGYRRGCSLQDAVERIVQLRDRGFTWVVDADIHDCFGSLDHRLLQGFVDRVVPDPVIRRLIRMWMGMDQEGGRGIPLGAVISPFLCNIYLHHLDVGLGRRRLKSVRYADDFIVLCKSHEHAQWAFRGIEKVLHGLQLELSSEKTRVTSFEEGFNFLGIHFEGTDYSYLFKGKHITVDELPPTFFHAFPRGYG